MEDLIFTKEEMQTLLVELGSKERKKYLKARRFIVEKCKEKKMHEAIKLELPTLSIHYQDYEIALYRAIQSIRQEVNSSLRRVFKKQSFDIKAALKKHLCCLTKEEEYNFGNLERGKRLLLIQKRCETAFHQQVKEFYESKKDTAMLRIHLADALLQLNRRIEKKGNFSAINLTGYLFRQFKVQLGIQTSPLTARVEEAFLQKIDAFQKTMDEMVSEIRERCFTYYFSSLGKRYELLETDFNLVYNDALLSLRDNLLTNKFERKSSITTYLYRIVEYKCIDYLRKYRPKSKEESTSLEEPLVEKPIVKVKKDLDNIKRYMFPVLLKQAMERMGDKCRDLLEDETDGIDLTTIAETYGYKDEGSAGVALSKCKKQLKGLIKLIATQETKVEG